MPFDDAGVRAAITAERALLASVAAGCGASSGALAFRWEPYFAGELTDAAQFGRHVGAELLNLGAGALGADPVLRGPGRGLMGNE